MTFLRLSWLGILWLEGGGLGDRGLSNGSVCAAREANGDASSARSTSRCKLLLQTVASAGN